MDKGSWCLGPVDMAAGHGCCRWLSMCCHMGYRQGLRASTRSSCRSSSTRCPDKMPTARTFAPVLRFSAMLAKEGRNAPVLFALLQTVA